MENALNFLFLKEWWTYDEAEPWPGQLYHWFNLVEGVAWLVVATLVFRRHRTYRHSLLEPVYGAAFVLFGLSDFREAYRLQSWLIVAKIVILLILLILRRHVLRRFYPDGNSF